MLPEVKHPNVPKVPNIHKVKYRYFETFGCFIDLQRKNSNCVHLAEVPLHYSNEIVLPSHFCSGIVSDLCSYGTWMESRQQQPFYFMTNISF